MAKLRYNLRGDFPKFIVKQGKLSCQCCEPPIRECGCCMFRADKYNVLYTFEDLPETVELEGPLGQYYEAQKTQNDSILGAIYIAEVPTADGSEYRAIKFDEDLIRWRFWEASGGPILTNGSWDVGRNCLFREVIVDETICQTDQKYVRDTFEQSYNYVVEFEGDTLESGLLIRTSLCNWASSVEGATFRGIEYDSETARFLQSDFDDLLGFKTPPHNSPAGEYIDPGGLYEGAVITVS